MAIQSRSLTYDDLQRMRETRDERLELIDGELFVTPSPSPMHQDISGNLYILFRNVVFESGRGRVYYAPLDVRLDENTVVQPDLIIVLSDRSPVLTISRVEGVPSLAVEITSPSTSAYDRVRKRNLYAQYGVPEYWLVDPGAKTVTVFSVPEDGRYQTETVSSDVAVSATIPGLSADLKALFAPVPGL
jgi:Uma2 family endonuclease